SYNVRDTATALKRMELNAAFLFTIPGPKMVWQFGELGYDYPINYCTNGTVNNNCRLDPKPVRWDYLNDTRRKNVYTTYSKLINLRFHNWYKDAFLTGTISRDVAGNMKWIKVSSGDSSHLLVIGNFAVTPQTTTVTFQSSGTWYDFLGSGTITAAGTAQNITLEPGEFHVYLNRNLNNTGVTPVVNIPWNGISLEAKVYPNPALAQYGVQVNIPQAGNLSIDLYTTLGQYVHTVYNGFLIKGTHQLSIKKGTVSSGNYYLHLRTKTSTKTIPVTFQ
ncbi:MAG: T9SS type A sorting domain-containing protein, partial [Flavisolibacter sp.]